MTYMFILIFSQCTYGRSTQLEPSGFVFLSAFELLSFIISFS